MTITPRSLPETPEHVTDAWLTCRLREAGVLRAGRVIAHKTSPVETQGAAGVVARFSLTYDFAERAPPTLVAKFASPYAPIRNLMHQMGAYANECEFYRHFGADAGIPVPACFGANIDPESGAFALLLEDMTAARVIEGPELSVDDVELAVRHLAPFHARWWSSERLRELEFLRYPGSDRDRAFMAQAAMALEAALPVATERYADELPALLVKVAQRMLGNFDGIIGLRRERMMDHVTLVHGDFHPGQLFFPSERGGRFAVFDWQTVSAGNGGDDLARIIVSGLNPEQQEAHDRRLIELYHGLLIENGVRDFDLAQCYDAYRVGLVVTAVMNIIASVNIDPAYLEAAAASGLPMAEGMFGWVAAAIEAHDALSAISI